MPRRASWPRHHARLGLGLGLALVLAYGCAYTLSSVVPGHIKSLAVPVFANSTVEFGISEDVTRAVQDAFQANGRLTLAGERQADSVLRGTVVAYRDQVFGYTQQERATSYEIVLTVRLSFRDLVRNRDLWKEDALTVRTTYNVVAVGNEPARTSLEARAEVVRKLADQIVSRTVQGW